MKPQSALYIVATPIGNLGDISPRAIETLKMVDFIAAEDTRHSAKLMQHFSIQRPLVAYHDHTSVEQSQRMIERLQKGESAALISDAGTPLISDPGYRLVSLARDAGIQVVPIPGACAFVAALCAAGLPSDRFIFEGFPPAKTSARKSYFQLVEKEERTLVYYESPHRIVESLYDMQEVFGASRNAVMARELTKTFETFLHGSIEDLCRWVKEDANQQKGEIVLVVEGLKQEVQEELAPEVQHTMRVLMDELPLKQAAALTAKICDEKKNKLYKWGLAQS